MYGRRSVQEQPPFYVFNSDDSRGFVVISADDRTEPVLGYTERGYYSEETINDNLREWFDAMSEAITSLAATPDNPDRPRYAASHPAVAPLIKTQWSQGYATETGLVYNILCPTYNNLYCFTGCVATAMAQLMYYYQWPKAATQTIPAYESNTSLGTLDALPPITFAWDKMQLTYDGSESAEQIRAVAELMRYCGQNAEMNYGTGGTGGSGAYPYTAMKNMVKNFDYDPSAEYVSRYNYTIAQWDNLILNELANHRPVLYSGYSYSIGHAFLVDGYDGDGHYHINWGWGGSYDGYFVLHVADPERDGGGYSFGQDAVIGLQPNTGQQPADPSDDEEEEDDDDGNIVATVMSRTIDGSSVFLNIGNMNEETYGFGFGIAELNGETVGQPLLKKDYYARTMLPCGWSFQGIEFNLAQLSLPEGKHSLVVVSREKNSTEYKRCKPYKDWIEVTVGGNGSVSDIVYHPIISLQATDVKLLSIDDGRGIANMSFRITNNGEDYKGYLYMGIDITDSEHIYRERKLDLKAGESVTIQRIFYLKDTPYGTYYVTMKTDDVLLGKATLDITPHITATNVACTSSHIVGVPQQVTAVIKNTGVDYTGPIYLFAAKTGTASTDFSSYTGTAVEAGDTENVLLFFRPTEAGHYTCKIATDDQCSNVIGSVAFNVQAPPTTPAKLEIVEEVFEGATTTTLSIRVKNTGTVTFYDCVGTYLWEITEEGYSLIFGFKDSEYLTLQPGQTADLYFEFTGLTKDKKYRIQTTYNQLFGDYNSSQNLKNDFFFPHEMLAIGDVNGDGTVNISDVTLLVNIILGNATDPYGNADVNGDGTVNISDVTLLVNIILGNA